MDGACWCCSKIFKISEGGFGLNRGYVGLCPSCGPKVAACIKRKAIQAAKKIPDDCTDSVIYAAESMGISMPPAGPTNSTGLIKNYLGGDKGNDDWEKVSMKEAAEGVERGEFIIAGLPGHVTIVVTGPGTMAKNKDTGVKEKWPNVAGGSDGGWAYSEGEKTIRGAWRDGQREKVSYYRSKRIPTLCCPTVTGTLEIIEETNKALNKES